jgi:hypothetical protein
MSTTGKGVATPLGTPLGLRQRLGNAAPIELTLGLARSPPAPESTAPSGPGSSGGDRRRRHRSPSPSPQSSPIQPGSRSWPGTLSQEGLRSMFVPEAHLVPREYWQHRALVLALGLVSTAKAALTAQAHMIAIGVGDPNATPLNYIFISETNAAISRFVGLALSPVRALLLAASQRCVVPCWGGGSGSLLDLPLVPGFCGARELSVVGWLAMRCLCVFWVGAQPWCTQHISSSFFAMHGKRTLVLNATLGKLGAVFPCVMEPSLLAATVGVHCPTLSLTIATRAT